MCQTNTVDAQADGVTNNNGQPTTDLLGWCNACNTHTSVSSDDDGGFIRIFVGLYYAGTLPGARNPAAQSGPAPAGNRAANQSTSTTPAPRIVNVRESVSGTRPART
jgi:hypothetical protein